MNLAFLVFTLFHVIVPAVCVVFYDANPMWPLGSVIFSLAVWLTTRYSRSAPSKWSLCLASGISMLLSLMLGASYYMQGTGFNDQYFYHLDSETFAVAVSAYGAVFIPALTGFGLAFFSPLLLYRKGALPVRSSLPVVLIWAITIAATYPLHSWLGYWLGQTDNSSVAMPEIPAEALAKIESKSADITTPVENVPQENRKEQAGKVGKNIILIYAEGLEQLYFDQDIFGDVTPGLRKLSEKAHRFTNTYQLPGTNWTIAGIVASQCGFPLLVDFRMANNSTIASTDRPFQGEECLADILQSRGYMTSYMGGAQLDFAGKGNFLRTHGYTRILGRDDLLPLLPDPEYRNGWGLHDDSLFELALQELEELETAGEPYLLTLLTLGTHHPKGFMAKSCKPLENSPDPMSSAIFCSDQLISRFIEQVMERVDMKRTVIALFSDHLAIRNTLWGTLRQHKEKRRLLWMVFDDQPGDSTAQVSTHFDLAPTLLDMAGVGSYPKLGMGNSLLAPDARITSGRPPEIDPDQVPRSINSGDSVRNSGFSIVYDELTISIGDLHIRANSNGWKFESGLFVCVLNEDGNVTDTIYTDDFPRLLSDLDGRMVVGVSRHEKDSEHGDQYFYGRLSPGLDRLKVLPLDSDISVAASELKF